MPIVGNNSLISNNVSKNMQYPKCDALLNSTRKCYLILPYLYSCYCRIILFTLLLKLLIPITVYDLINIV